MAKLYPSREVLLYQQKKPQDGELALINFLETALDDSFEIFVQPFINGDRPDVVVLREKSGVLIFEVKDWNLVSYRIDHNKNWKLERENQWIKSPLQQVFAYKKNLFDLHVNDFIIKRIKNPKMWAVVHCGIYFHNAKEQELRSFLVNGHEKDDRYKKFLRYFEIWGYDSLNENYLKNRLKFRWLNRPSKLFTRKIYKNIRWLLKPSYHEAEEGIKLTYSSKQRELIKSRPVQQKIRGVAGSGKTLILAKRAVEAHKRTNSKILILTYNITLKNYIHDRIGEVREDFDWNYFHIINYHQFILAELNNFGVKIQVPKSLKGEALSAYFEDNYFSNRSLFEKNKDKIQAYEAIFIDEVQDYKTAWIDIIRDYYLKQNGELVLYGDEKQNIYAREMGNDGKPNTGILGRWNELDETYRLKANNINVSEAFQREFMSDRYEIDRIMEAEQGYLFQDESVSIYKFVNPNTEPTQIADYIIRSVKAMGINLNDVTVLGETVKKLRQIEYYVRNSLKQFTNSMFENMETYDLIKKQYGVDEWKSQREIEKVRRSKKANFWMNRGHIKFSTVHSFKGWEIHTLFLLVEPSNPASLITQDELIYTGLTRCMNNLLVLNLGNERYHDFFNQFV